MDAQLLHADHYWVISYSCRSLQPFARHKDEETAECRIDENYGRQDHPSSLDQKLANEGLFYPGEAEEGVFREADECEDWIEHVLMRREKVHAYGEWQYDLDDDEHDLPDLTAD